MKKIMILLLAVILVTGMAACSSTEPTPVKDDDEGKISAGEIVEQAMKEEIDEEIRQAWDPLCGRWNAAGDVVVDFDYNEYGDPTIAIGKVDNDGRKATFEKAMSPLTYELGEWNKLIFRYEEPLDFKEIYIDLSGLDRDGSINLKQGEDGEVIQLGRNY